MVDYPYEANFLAPLPAYPVKASCQILLNADNTLKGLAQAAGEYRVLIKKYKALRVIL